MFSERRGRRSLHPNIQQLDKPELNELSAFGSPYSSHFLPIITHNVRVFFILWLSLCDLRKNSLVYILFIVVFAFLRQ